MRPILLMLFSGCCFGCGLTDDPDIRELKASLRITGEEVTAKQDESLTILRENTAALQAIKYQVENLNGGILETRRALGTMEASLSTADLNRKDGDPAAREPQETERKSQTTPLLSDSPSAVRLFVTSSESCAPCVRLWKAVKNGEFSGFDVRHSTNFEGLRSYPAIRFQDSQGQWKVIYGYDDTTVETLRRLTSTNQFVSQPRITNPVVSQTDLVSMHNQLHGGGQWTWPGDLATHLQTVHGVNLNGIPANHGTSQFASQRSAVRLVSRGSPRGWRSSYQARSSCPAGGCPR